MNHELIPFQLGLLPAPNDHEKVVAELERLEQKEHKTASAKDKWVQLHMSIASERILVRVSFLSQS